MHTDGNFADSVQYNSAYANHQFLLIFNHKNHSCELPDCVHMISTFTSIYPLLSYLLIIYKLCTIADNEQSHAHAVKKVVCLQLYNHTTYKVYVGRSRLVSGTLCLLPRWHCRWAARQTLWPL